MDVDITNLILSQIAFPPAHTNLLYSFNIPFKPENASRPMVEIFAIPINKPPPVLELPSNLLKFIDNNAIQCTAKFFKYEQLRQKFEQLQLHSTSGTFPQHYKININTHLKTITEESLITHSKTAILTAEISNVYSKASLLAGEIAQSSILLIANIMELTTNTSSLKNNKSLFYDHNTNPILLRWRSTINETVIRFEENQIRHRNKLKLEKEKKETKRLAFQDSLQKKDILLKTSSTLNFTNNAALLQTEFNKLHAKISLLEKQLSGNALGAKKSHSTPAKKSNLKNQNNNKNIKPKATKKTNNSKTGKSKEQTENAKKTKKQKN